jgi:hypothetical protein
MPRLQSSIGVGYPHAVRLSQGGDCALQDERNVLQNSGVQYAPSWFFGHVGILGISGLGIEKPISPKPL